MFIGRVIGEVWSTRKVPDLEGKRLLVVDPLRGDWSGVVEPVVAADPIGAGRGEEVLVAFGKAARVACGGDGDFAYEAAIVGIVDGHHVPDWESAPPGDRAAASGGER